MRKTYDVTAKRVTLNLSAEGLRRFDELQGMLSMHYAKYLRSAPSFSLIIEAALAQTFEACQNDPAWLEGLKDELLEASMVKPRSDVKQDWAPAVSAAE